MNTALPTRLANVEDGYAEVIRTDTNRRIGRVSREKSGSLRTSVIWHAKGNGFTGTAYTRSGAVALVIAAAVAREQKMAAWS